ncbi:MAG: hypothetical protein ACYYK0_08075 [Candidatus Eutrophobiaceae bacterium]
MAREDDTRFSGQICTMQTVTQTLPMQRFAQEQLRADVFVANMAHNA